jgi:hypothetical protein
LSMMPLLTENFYDPRLYQRRIHKQYLPRLFTSKSYRGNYPTRSRSADCRLARFRLSLVVVSGTLGGGRMTTYCRALRIARIKHPIEYATLVVAIVTLLVTAVVGGIALWQIWGLWDTLDSQSENVLDQDSAEIEKTLIQFPGLAPYFDHVQAWPAKPDEVQVLRHITEMKLDYIDAYFGQKSYLSYGTTQTQSWCTYIKVAMTQSNLLCDVWKTEQGQHSHGLERVATKICLHTEPDHNPCP